MRNRMWIFGLLAIVALGGLAALPYTVTVHAENRETVAARSDQRTSVLTVENMTCAACPITVRKTMAGVDGVKSVAVEFEAKRAKVVYDPAVTTIEAIAAASTNAGYPAHSVE